ncbi:hypothetical protein JCM11491_000920 [Sporobolomyces phaffii]
MVRSTIIARATDGLPLAASNDDDEQDQSKLPEYKQQAKLIFRRLTPQSEPRCSIESGACTLHYLISDSIVYLTIADRSYPRKLAFSYLSELSNEFTRSYPPEMSLKSGLRPYAFVKFDTFIQRTKRLYLDPRGAEASGKGTGVASGLEQLNEDLQDVTRIMTKNMEDLLWRGDSLDRMSTMSSSLRDESLKYRKAAKKINTDALIRKWAPVGIAGLLFFVFVYYRFSEHDSTNGRVADFGPVALDRHNSLDSVQPLQRLPIKRPHGLPSIKALRERFQGFANGGKKSHQGNANTDGSDKNGESPKKLAKRVGTGSIGKISKLPPQARGVTPSASMPVLASQGSDDDSLFVFDSFRLATTSEDLVDLDTPQTSANIRESIPDLSAAAKYGARIDSRVSGGIPAVEPGERRLGGYAARLAELKGLRTPTLDGADKRNSRFETAEADEIYAPVEPPRLAARPGRSTEEEEDDESRPVSPTHFTNSPGAEHPFRLSTYLDFLPFSRPSSNGAAPPATTALLSLSATSTSAQRVDPSASTPNDALDQNLTLAQMEREIVKMERELALAGTPRSFFTDEASLDASHSDLPPSSSQSAMESPIVDESVATPQTTRKWSIVEVEKAYERMKRLLGSSSSSRMYTPSDAGGERQFKVGTEHESAGTETGMETTVRPLAIAGNQEVDDMFSPVRYAAASPS